MYVCECSRVYMCVCILLLLPPSPQHPRSPPWRNVAVIAPLRLTPVSCTLPYPTPPTRPPSYPLPLTPPSPPPSHPLPHPPTLITPKEAS